MWAIAVLYEPAHVRNFPTSMMRKKEYLSQRERISVVDHPIVRIVYESKRAHIFNLWTAHNAEDFLLRISFLSFSWCHDLVIITLRHIWYDVGVFDSAIVNFFFLAHEEMSERLVRNVERWCVLFSRVKLVALFLRQILWNIFIILRLDSFIKKVRISLAHSLNSSQDILIPSSSLLVSITD